MCAYGLGGLRFRALTAAERAAQTVLPLFVLPPSLTAPAATSILLTPTCFCIRWPVQLPDMGGGMIPGQPFPVTAPVFFLLHPL